MVFLALRGELLCGPAANEEREAPSPGHKSLNLFKERRPHTAQLTPVVIREQSVDLNEEGLVYDSDAGKEYVSIFRSDATRDYVIQGDMAKYDSRSSKRTCRSDDWNILDPLRSNNSIAVVEGEVGKHFDTVKRLGVGAFGTVWEVRSVDSGDHFAMKSMPRAHVDAEALESELSISKRLRHANLVRLHQSFVDEKSFHLIMELCRGGNLHEKVSNCWRLPNKQLCGYLWQMLAGLAYLHHHGYVHRDVKPENYLLETVAPDALLKLSDFGLAVKRGEGTKLKEVVGTIGFAAPEVLQNSEYDELCDVWSLGAVLYFMATGHSPVDDLYSPQEQWDRNLRGEVPMNDPIWALRPKEIPRLVEQMTQTEQSGRPSIKELMRQNLWLSQSAEAADPVCCSIS